MQMEKLKIIGKIVGVTAAVYLVFKYLLPLVAPFVIAFLLALMIEKPVGFLEKRLRLKRWLSSGILVVIGLILLGLFFRFVVSRLFEQLKKLIASFDSLNVELRSYMCNMCNTFDSVAGLRKGTSIAAFDESVMNAGESVAKEIVPTVVNNSIPALVYVLGALGVIIITLLSIILFSAHMNDIRAWKEHSIFANELSKGCERIGRIGAAYIRAQLIIMSITAILCVIGFYIIGNEYALLFGAIVGVMDALPLFGSGVILIPMTIVLLFQKRFWQAATIFTLFVICYIIRQLLEPKLMGTKLGVSSLEMLISIYVGLMVFGFMGFILGPVGYIIIKEVTCQSK